MTEAIQQFVFYGGRPRLVDTQTDDMLVLVAWDDEETAPELPIEEAIVLTSDETLILRNPAELSDDELLQGLEACDRQRLTVSDRPVTAKTREKKATKAKKEVKMTDELASIMGIEGLV